MKRVVERQWNVQGYEEETVRYEPENDWEANHLELLTMSPLFPVGCMECAGAIYDILHECAKEHGIEFVQTRQDET